MISYSALDATTVLNIQAVEDNAVSIARQDKRSSTSQASLLIDFCAILDLACVFSTVEYERRGASSAVIIFINAAKLLDNTFPLSVQEMCIFAFDANSIFPIG